MLDKGSDMMKVFGTLVTDLGILCGVAVFGLSFLKGLDTSLRLVMLVCGAAYAAIGIWLRVGIAKADREVRESK